MIWPPDLKAKWWSFTLPGIRDHPDPATYYSFSFSELPPIAAPADHTFAWLQAEPKHEKWSLAANGYPDGSQSDLSWLPRLIEQAQVSLPASFITFLRTDALHEHIRSCTACFLELSDFVVTVTQPVVGVLLHFLSDQQWCLHWYLYASRSGNHCVVVSGKVYGLPIEPGEERIDTVDLTKEAVWLCADTFTDFIYRFWLENEIWFALYDGKPLSAIQMNYLEYYRKR